MDDFSVIVNNPDVRSLGDFFAKGLPLRPLRGISCLIDYAVFGLDPWGYHFQNIFWHALNCWLLYRLSIRLKLSSTVAWLSALLFLVHPVHVEVVANSSHRKDSLALAFLLLALMSYMTALDQKVLLRRVLWLTGTFILWLTAFFAKGNALVFPLLMLVYENAVVPKENRIILRWNGLFRIFSLVCGAGLLAWYLYIASLPSFRVAIIGVFVKTDNLASFSVPAYILMVLKSFAFMVSKLILPLNLSMEYVYSVPKSFFDPWVFGSLIVIPLGCVAAYKWEKSSPVQHVLLVCAAILWLPTANIIWPLTYFAADRYMYAPSATLCILAVLISERALHAAKRYMVVGWCCVLCLFALLSWKQIRVWHNEMSLYSHMLKVSPHSLEAMIGLANAYYDTKEYDLSENYARQALERDGTDDRPYLLLGNISLIRNNLPEALTLIQESLRRSPQSPEGYNAMGTVYDEMGNSRQAIESYRTALKLRPFYGAAETNLGVAYERANNLQDAESMLNKALALDRNDVSAWFTLGVVRYKNNDKQGARSAFSEAVRLNPSHADALTNLTIVCKELGDEACYNDAMRRKRLIDSAPVETQRAN